MTNEFLLIRALRRLIRAVSKYPVKDIPEVAQAVDLALLTLVKVSGEEFEIKDLFKKAKGEV